jgi:hypothetical protein
MNAVRARAPKHRPMTLEATATCAIRIAVVLFIARVPERSSASTKFSEIAGSTLRFAPVLRGRSTATRGNSMARARARSRSNQININRPSTRVVIVSVVIAILALIGYLTRVEFLTEYQFLLAIFAYVILLAGVLFRGL